MLFLGILPGCVILARTAGFVLPVALLGQGLIVRVVQKRSTGANWGIAAIAMASFVLIMLVPGPERESHYLETLGGVLARRDPTHIGTGWSARVGQAQTLLDTWRTFFTVYWIDDLAFNSIVVLAMLASSAWVMVARLMSNQLDAWYVLGSIMLLLIWPHPGQMLRLIFPLMPILVVYAVHGALRATQALPRKELVRLLAAIVVAMAILPAHAFMLGRIQFAAERGLVPVYEIFRRPGLEAALNELVVQNQMMADFARLEASVSQEDKILYFEPAYVAILGNRIGVPAPAPVSAITYRELARRSGARYLFVTAMHPRQTRAGINGFSGVSNLDGWTEKLWCSVSVLDGSNVSCLFRLNAAGR